MAPKGKKTTQRSAPRRKVEPAVKIKGSENAVATGPRSFAASIRVIFQGNWRPFSVVLGVVAVLLTVILWYVVPKDKKEMTGQFNVAVAEFLMQDRNGKPVRGEDGALLSAYVAEQIETQFNGIELAKTISFEIWGPDKVRPIKGGTADERRQVAAEVAEKIRAHVLVYGIIVVNGDQSKFMPEFYINHKGFWQASEITGSHEIGSQLRLALPLSESIQAIENPALAGRVNALNLITIGLAYYSVDDYQNAASYFERAAAEPRWLEGSGKEVAYLLVGNAYIGWVSKDNDAQYLPQAERNYAEALRINPKYGRGVIGLANITYLESLGPLQEPKIDPVKLDEAVALTEKALALRDQLESANIPAKAHFNLGQISMARYQAKITGEDWLEKAKQEFTFVTQEYESGDVALETYAAHAYCRLGYIAYLQNDAETAITMVKKSISLAPPFYKAKYSATLGDIYKNLGQKDLAKAAYEDAIAIAESLGDANKVQEYQQRLNALEQP